MRKRLGILVSIGGVSLVLVGLGILVLWREPAMTPAPASKPAASGAPATKPMSTVSAALSSSVKTAPARGLWTRPPPKVAERNLQRCHNGSSLKPLGAGEGTIDRLSGDDVQAAVADLKQQAQSGDLSARNVLNYLAHFTCLFAAMNAGGSTYAASQLLDSQALPAADGDWVRAAMADKVNYNRQLAEACQTIDRKETEAWVAAGAAQGDPVSQYLSSMFRLAPGVEAGDQSLLAAANAGFPWAQLGVATRTIDGLPLAPSIGTAVGNVGDLLRGAAVALPQAEAQLAKCEFKGCTDIPVDLPTAVRDAREAAERGDFDAMLEIGPQLQASQIDPDEVAAWNLVHAALEIQGYAAPVVDAKTLKAASGVLSSSSISDRARELADQYWKDYGTKMLAGLGCTS